MQRKAFKPTAVDGVSGHLYASADLLLGKRPRRPIGYEAGWASEPVLVLLQQEESLTPQLGIEPLFTNGSARIVVTVLTELSRSLQ